MVKKMIGETGSPLICAPLVGVSEEQLLAELDRVLGKKPDIIEWRVDFFDKAAEHDAVCAMVDTLKARMDDLPLIFTFRSQREGGQPVAMSEAEIFALNVSVCERTAVEYIDCELSSQPEHIGALRAAAAAGNTKIIGSYHNFTATPSCRELVDTLAQAQAHGLDVAKAAVMPQKPEDVLTLLSATLEAKQQLQIPLITMSMGKFGAVSRLIGGVFGSSLSFAVGANASAPGQVPIEDMQEALAIVSRAMGGGN